MRANLVLACILIAAAGCGRGAPAPESSGDAGMDQTAAYVLDTVRRLESRGEFSAPSEIIAYLASTRGSAELVPPNASLEPDLAAAHRGPRPAEGVWIQSGLPRNPFFKQHLVLLADDEQGAIVAEAYGAGEEPFFRWTWKVR